MLNVSFYSEGAQWAVEKIFHRLIVRGRASWQQSRTEVTVIRRKQLERQFLVDLLVVTPLAQNQAIRIYYVNYLSGSGAY